MHAASGTIARGREILLVSLGGAALAILMTWPLATGLTHLGRTAPNDADGQFAIWNISWVARTLVADPIDLYDANIYVPRKRTLAYSEANLLPGAIGVVPYWLTRNPWLTLNAVLLVAFASGFVGAYLFLLYLFGNRTAAAVGGVIYAFCPYVMSHLSHIQLLFTGGVPLALYLLHRLVDAPFGEGWTRALRTRAILLGLALAAQALSCAYYGIFAGLMVGYATLLLGWTRGLWTVAAYWQAIGLAAGVSILLTGPFFAPFLLVQQETGFARSTEDAARYSARLVDYIVSPAHAHGGLLAYARTVGPYLEVLFPGFVAVGLGVIGLFVVLRWSPADEGRQTSRDRETALLYGTLGLLALWSSFGPNAGLYRVLSLLPVFSFLRAPSRLGLVVVLCLIVFACIALRALFTAVPARYRLILGAGAIVIAIADVAVFPLRWATAPTIPAAYDALEGRPRAPLAAFPFYASRIAYPLHTQYMLFSTRHWLPMVNGYSDVIPPEFRESAPILDSFPSREAFAILARRRVRYIAVHWDMYVHRKDDIRRQLEPYLPNLQELAGDDRMTLYEVVKYP